MRLTEVMVFALGFLNLISLWITVVVDYAAFKPRVRIWSKANKWKYLAHG